MAQVLVIHNENYGYSVASYDNFASVGNPSLLKYVDPTGSLATGSVDIYKYNNVSDLHDLKKTVYRPLSPDEVVYINTEDANLQWQNLHYSFWEQLTESLWQNFNANNLDLLIKTEDTGNVSYTSNSELIIDGGNYFSASEDDFGHAIDMNRFTLAVGSRYFKSEYEIGPHSIVITGSGYVYLYDLSRLNLTPYDTYQQPVWLQWDVGASDSLMGIWMPPGHNFSQIVFEGYSPGGAPLPDIGWHVVSVETVTTDVFGLDNLFQFTVPNSIALYYSTYRVTGIRGIDPYVSYIQGPASGSVTSSTVETSSFGYSVSLNDEWLAVGDPDQYGYQGVVHLYRKYKGIYGSPASWSYFQTITASDSAPSDRFGQSLALNKGTGSFSSSMVVGSLRSAGAKVYYFEYNGSCASSESAIIPFSTNSVWQEKYTLEPNYASYPLTFLPDVYPILSASQGEDGYGQSVDIYGNTVIVGAPTDRVIYEYSGSPAFKQGAAYIYEKCPNAPLTFELKLKTYGNEKTLKNNKLGWSTGVWGEHAVAGSPNINVESMSLCYIRGTLFQEHFGTAEEEEIENQSKYNGQFILFQKDTSSLDWDILNVYQNKKKLKEPYRNFGYDVSTSEDFIVVGAPLTISGSYRRMDMGNTGSYTWDGNADDLGDVHGKAYIYNLANLRETFYVGNVFYRNGKLVIMTSGSSFAGILINTVSTNEYSYELDFKSSHVLYEKQIICPVDVGEFNVSTNPTSLIQNSSSLDLNNNGKFDFQDVDVLLRFLKYRNTEGSSTSNVSFDWSSSILSTADEISYYNLQYNLESNYNSRAVYVYSQSFDTMNASYYSLLDINGDNLADNKDIGMIWKYFSNRLNQNNYEDYITPNSQRQTFQDIMGYLESISKRNDNPKILTEFFNYSTNIKSDPTGSYLVPMTTTIGLYSGTELVAVAKLGAPIKLAPDFPINFIVKLDF